VPLPIAGATDFNAFVQPLIDRYGYIQNGVRVGGGVVGYGQQFDDIDFFRDAAEVGYNLTLGTRTLRISIPASLSGTPEQPPAVP
jgi:hypothetical protein